MQARYCAVLIAAVVLAGCQKNITRDEAKAVLPSNSFFQDTRYFDVPITVPTGDSSCRDLDEGKPGWRQMVDMGFATAHAHPSGDGCELQLTPAGQSASAKWRKEGGMWKVPVATKLFGQVTEIDFGLTGTTAVKFTWRWAPTPIGQRMPNSAASNEKGVAQMRKTAQGWQVVTIQ